MRAFMCDACGAKKAEHPFEVTPVTAACHAKLAEAAVVAMVASKQ
jgi:hypothetical protein